MDTKSSWITWSTPGDTASTEFRINALVACRALLQLDIRREKAQASDSSRICDTRRDEQESPGAAVVDVRSATRLGVAAVLLRCPTRARRRRLGRSARRAVRVVGRSLVRWPAPASADRARAGRRSRRR